MKKQDISRAISNIRKATIKHTPELLTGIGIAGMVTSTVFAVKATPKAIKLIEKEVDRQNKELREEAAKNGDSSCTQISKLKPVDVIKVAWKPYISSAVIGATSIVCLLGASSVNMRRNAALATAYKLSETALSEYKEQVVATIGEKKEKVVKEKVAKDRIEKNPVGKNQVYITKKGETLCYEHLSARYFKSDIDIIKRAENTLNKRMLNEMYISLNEFYDEIGLEHNGVGEDLGWNIEDGLIDIDFSSLLAEDGTPCVVIDYNRPPKYNYQKLY